MGWLDTMTPKPGGSRHCSDDYMTVYFSAKYSSKCYNGIPLSRQKSENSSEMRGN